MTRKYTLDETVFETINSEEKAYWLGFILADGSISISKAGQHTVKLSLQSGDKEHLQKFKTFVKTSMPVKEYKNKTAKSGFSCELAITSKKIVEDLQKLGIGPKKSHTVEIPEVPENLIRHLIRGIWDGDGSVLYNRRNAKYEIKVPIAQICGNEKVLTKINDIFQTHLEIKKAKLSKAGSIFLFRKMSSSAQKVINFLYKDCNISLDRKLEKAKCIFDWKPSRKVGY